jgi:hypothetical protein
LELLDAQLRQAVSNREWHREALEAARAQLARCITRVAEAETAVADLQREVFRALGPVLQASLGSVASVEVTVLDDAGEALWRHWGVLVED